MVDQILQIPSAFRLILALFEPKELNIALTIFGLSGAIANVTGLVIAGFFGFITANDQQAGWRWFFRVGLKSIDWRFAQLTIVSFFFADDGYRNCTFRRFRPYSHPSIRWETG